MPTYPLPRDMLGVDDSVQPKLARHEEPDIDQLMPKVEQAIRAYAICKERLEAVQETLGRYFQYFQPKDASPAPTSTPVVSRRLGNDGQAREDDGEFENPF
jgi:hypothetical protein